MKLYVAAACAVLMISSTAQSQDPSAPPATAVSALTCEQIGAELTELVGTTTDVALTAAERANRKRNNPTSVANAVTGHGPIRAAQATNEASSISPDCLAGPFRPRFPRNRPRAPGILAAPRKSGKTRWPRAWCVPLHLAFA